MKKSNNSFTKKEFTRGKNSWAGDNITASAAGFDEILSGVAPGVGEPGGIDHFKNIDQPEVNH